jgi:dienelactone hydrolase
LDAYRYLQANVHKDLEARNSSLKLAGDRIAALGWSAGGHLVIALVRPSARGWS